MSLIGALQTLVDGQIITAAQHNSNYSDIKTAFNTSAVLTDVAKTITVGHTWAASQTWSAAQAFGAGATVTGTLGLNVGAKFTTPNYDPAVKETVFGYSSVYKVLQIGTLAVQRAIALGFDPSTNPGTNFNGNEIMVPNAMKFTMQNVAGTDWVNPCVAFGPLGQWLVGTATTAGTAAGDLVLGARIYFVPAVSKLVPGATSFSLRNAADGADNFIMTDAGDATMRGILNMTLTTTPIKLANNAQISWRNFANTADAFGIGTDVTDNLRVGVSANFAGVMIGLPNKKLAFFGGAPVVQPVVVGAKGGNVALANLMTALAAMSLVVDNTT